MRTQALCCCLPSVQKQDDEGNQGAEISEEKKCHICQYCYLAFSDSEQFMDHMEIHGPAEDATTDACDVKCEQYDVDKHLEAHENLSVPNKDQENPVPGIKVENCEYDKQVAHTTIINAPAEKVRSHSTSSFVCSRTCCKTFMSNEKFQNNSVIHGTPTCEVCGKTFKQPNILVEHMLIHSDDKAFKCDICGEKFWKPEIFANAQSGT